MIDWNNIITSKEECQIIAKIASRANHIGIDRERIDLIMDLELAHHACPLRLDDLLNASEADLAHDVGGIITHLNRETGAILDEFFPRYAA